MYCLLTMRVSYERRCIPLKNVFKVIVLLLVYLILKNFDWKRSTYKKIKTTSHLTPRGFFVYPWIFYSNFLYIYITLINKKCQYFLQIFPFYYPLICFATSSAKFSSFFSSPSPFSSLANLTILAPLASTIFPTFSSGFFTKACSIKHISP